MNELAIINPENTLSILEQAKTTLAASNSLPEIKDIRDKAEAVRKYLSAQGLSLPILLIAAEIRLRAERKAGQLLAGLPLHGGDRRSPTVRQSISLTDLRIKKATSSRWQKIGRLSEPLFEAYVERARQASRAATTVGLLRYAIRHEPSANKLFCKIAQQLKALHDRHEQYGCVHITPPWALASQRPGRSQPSLIRELASLPIHAVLAAQAHLHLWVPISYLMQAAQLLSAWGVRYVSNLVVGRSSGIYTPFWHAVHEHIIVATRGHQTFKDTSLPSWISLSEDSVAPLDTVRDLIVQVSPGPYLDIFSSQPRSGWTTIS